MLITALLAVASAADAPQWTVQVDPLTAALGFAHVQVERALAPRWSVYAGPHLRLYNGIISEPDEAFRGYGLEAGLRVYPKAEAPEGPWALVRGVGAFLHTTDGSEERGPGGYASVLGGYTWIPGGRLVLSGGLGVQYIHYEIAGMGPKGVLPAAHTAIGVAF